MLMLKSLLICFFSIISLISISQNNNQENLLRLNNCDSTLSSLELLKLIIENRTEENLSRNDSLFDKFQKLEKDSLFTELEAKSSKHLEKNPLSLTASYYYTISLLRQNKRDNLRCNWDRTQLIHRAIETFGNGSKSSPYILTELSDAKTLIIMYQKEGTKVNSFEIQKPFTLAHVSFPNGKNDIVYFDFRSDLSIREINFNYKRDFEFYLSESKNSESNYHYNSLLERFQKNDQSLKKNEIIALMIGFTNNKNYFPYKNLDKERTLMNLVHEKEYKKALKQCREFLKTNPLNFTALMEEGFSLMKIKDNRNLFPSIQSKMLVEAILWSGNGSKKHPYFVLSPIDGQTIIKYIFGGNIGTMGSGGDSNGYFLDMLEFVKEGEDSRTLYFNIEHAMNNSEFNKQLKK